MKPFFNSRGLAPVNTPSAGCRPHRSASVFITGSWPPRRPMSPRAKLLFSLPVIAVAVIVLVYFRLFASPVVIAVIFILYVVVSLRNRRKFRKQERGA